MANSSSKTTNRLMSACLAAVMLVSSIMPAYAAEEPTPVATPQAEERAVFLDGDAFNTAVKALAGNEIVSESEEPVADTSIGAVKWADSIPEDAETVTVSEEGSAPINAWYEAPAEDETAGTVWFYADSKTALPADASGMFSGMTALTDISMLEKVDFSTAETLEGMFTNDAYLADISPLADVCLDHVSSIDFMFAGCTSLNDVSMIGTHETEDGCTAWDIRPETAMANAFLGSGVAEETLPDWYVAPVKTEDVQPEETDSSTTASVENTENTDSSVIVEEPEIVMSDEDGYIESTESTESTESEELEEEKEPAKVMTKAPASATSTVEVSTTGAVARYSNGATKYYTFDGSGQHGVCVYPGYAGITSATRLQQIELTRSSDYYYTALAKLMYIMPWAPGFNNLSTAVDGASALSAQQKNAVKSYRQVVGGLSENSTDRYAYMHLILAYGYQIYRSNALQENITDVNRRWYGTGSGMYLGENDTYRQNVTNWMDGLWNYVRNGNITLPSNFRAYLVYGGEGSVQDYMYWKEEGVSSGYLRVFKTIDNENVVRENTSVAGAKYGVYKDLGHAVNAYASNNYYEGTPDAPIRILTIGANHYSNTVSLPVGTYYIKEIQAPTTGSWILAPNVITVNIRPENTASAPVTATSKEIEKLSSIRLRKVDEQGNPLKGAEFLVWRTSKASSDHVREFTVTSGDDGYTPDISNNAKSAYYVTPGVWAWKEKTAPAGYELDETVHTFVVDYFRNIYEGYDIGKESDYKYVGNWQGGAIQFPAGSYMFVTATDEGRCLSVKYDTNSNWAGIDVIHRTGEWTNGTGGAASANNWFVSYELVEKDGRKYYAATFTSNAHYPKVLTWNAANGTVSLADANGSEEQKWLIDVVEPIERIYIRSLKNQGYGLVAAGNSVAVGTMDATRPTKWAIVPTNTKTFTTNLRDGAYAMVPYVNRSKVIDLAGNDINSYLHYYDYNGTLAGTMRITPTGDGKYYLQKLGRYAYVNTSDNSNIYFTANKDDAVRWEVHTDDYGATYTFRYKQDGEYKYLVYTDSMFVRVKPESQLTGQEHRFHMLHSGSDITVTATNKKQSSYAYVQKTPEESAAAFMSGNSCYSLAGAEYRFYSDKERTKEIAVLTTDENGKTETVKLQPGTYYVKETKASKGCLLDPKMDGITNATSVNDDIDTAYWTFEVKAGETTEVMSVEPVIGDPVRIRISKTDAEGNSTADLSGAQFTVRYYDSYFTEDDYANKTVPADAKAKKTWVIETKENPKTPGNYMAELAQEYLVNKKEALYKVNGETIIPLGTIVITESQAPEGYEKAEGNLAVIKIDESYDGDEVAREINIDVPEQPVRYALKFTKKGSDGTVLAGIPFLLTNTATNESHVIVTDANGVFDSEAVPNTTNTNKNDEAYTDDNVNASALNSRYGLWFGNAEHADDAKNALTAGTYTMTELRTNANASYKLITLNFSVPGDIEEGTTLDLGELVDEKTEHDISTRVIDVKTGSKVSLAEKDASYRDDVTLTGYNNEKATTIVTKAYNVTDKKYVPFKDGSTAITTTVTATKEAQTVKVPFNLDASDLAGKKIAIETIVTNEEVEMGTAQEHNTNHTDENEMLYFPKVATVATVEGRKSAQADGMKTVQDVVKVTGLPSGTSVTAEAQLFELGASAEEDKAVEGASGSTKKSANKSDAATITTDLTFDTTASVGKSYYITEKVYITVGGKKHLVASETDRTNKNQTVSFMGIGTTLTDDETKSHVSFAGKDRSYTDTVAFTNLETGTYPVIMLIMDDKGYAMKKDGKAGTVLVEEYLTCKDETAKTAAEKRAAIIKALDDASIAYSIDDKTTDVKDGTFDMKMTLDASKLAGKKIVAAEAIYDDTMTIMAKHINPKDEDQTIRFPKIGTTAVDAKSGEKTVSGGKEAEIKDTITYSMAPKGMVVKTVAEVFVKGDKAADDKLLTSVTEETRTLQKESGSYSITIPVDTEGLGGKELYVTERIYVVVDGKDVPVSEHVDRNDKKQTVSVPKVKAQAWLHKVSADKHEGLNGVEFLFWEDGQEDNATTLITSANNAPTGEYAEEGQDKNGWIYFGELEAGVTYHYKETKTHQGLNLDGKEHTITVLDDGTIRYDGKTTTTPVLKLELTNGKTVTLMTGGSGTTVFYIIGGIMLAGLLVLIVVRKKTKQNG